MLFIRGVRQKRLSSSGNESSISHSQVKEVLCIDEVYPKYKMALLIQKDTEYLIHRSDGEAWKHFDNVYPDFASEPRSVRQRLCLDGFTPFFNAASPNSCQPVFLTLYNLPPEICMTSPYIFINCLIQGPCNPKSLIDVYLQPLIDEFKQMQFEGVLT